MKSADNIPLKSTSCDALRGLVDVGEDVADDEVGRLARLDVDDQLRAVEIEHRLRLVFVRDLALANRLIVGVVDAVFLERAALDAVVKLLLVGAGEVDHLLNVEAVGEHARLVAIARDAVEHEAVGLGLETSGGDELLDLLRPEVDRDVVGDERALAGVFEEGHADRTGEIEGTEHIAAREVLETGDAAEDFTLCAFARAGGTKEEDGLVFHKYNKAEVTTICKED